MARPLQTFINLLQNKGIRTQNMWEVDASSGYSDVDSKLGNLTLYASEFAVPERKQEVTEIPFKGYPLLIPTKMTMGNTHSMDVRCDVNGDIRRVFLKWMNYITAANISQGSYFGGEKRIPKNSIIRMKMLAGDMETVVETYKLYGIFVEKVGDLKMSNIEAGVATFNVEFRSQYWEIESATGDFPEQK